MEKQKWNKKNVSALYLFNEKKGFIVKVTQSLLSLQYRDIWSSFIISLPSFKLLPNTLLKLDHTLSSLSILQNMLLLIQIIELLKSNVQGKKELRRKRKSRESIFHFTLFHQ